MMIYRLNCCQEYDKSMKKRTWHSLVSVLQCSQLYAIIYNLYQSIYSELLRKQIENVNIARKEAEKNAEENKQLVKDTRDAYEDKLAKLVIKVEQWKKEADIQHAICQWLWEERDKCKSKLHCILAGT